MDINWSNVFDWVMLLKCFVTGGLICIIGQILIDKTKLTPARILVIFVTVGCVLGGLGIYQHLVDFAGAGATVPLTGFGYNLAKGAIEGVQQSGFVGAFTGGVKATAGGIAAAVFFRILSFTYFKTKNEKIKNQNQDLLTHNLSIRIKNAMDKLCMQCKLLQNLTSAIFIFYRKLSYHDNFPRR